LNNYPFPTRGAAEFLSLPVCSENTECEIVAPLSAPEEASSARGVLHKPGAQPTKVREACLDDYEDIARLVARYKLDARSFEEWSHLWRNNPVYQGREWWPIGWVLENREKEIVGHIGNIPLLYELQGRTLLAATGRAFVVDAKYRSHSFLLLDRYFRQPAVDLHLNTSVNSQAVGAYRTFRASQVPVGAWDRSSFWITNCRGFVESLLRSKSVPLATALSLPLALLPRLHDLFTSKKLQFERTGEVNSCSDFDERFDAFWDALKNTTSRLVAVRDRATLNWHFKYSLLRKRVWILTVGTVSRIDAYAIFFRDDNCQFKLKRMRLIDFQALECKYSLLLPIMQEALQRCRAEGIDMLEVLGYCPEKRKVIDDFIPYNRQIPAWMYFYRTKNRDLAEVLNRPEVWDPTGFDGDSSF